MAREQGPRAKGTSSLPSWCIPEPGGIIRPYLQIKIIGSPHILRPIPSILPFGSKLGHYTLERASLNHLDVYWPRACIRVLGVVPCSLGKASLSVHCSEPAGSPSPALLGRTAPIRALGSHRPSWEQVPRGGLSISTTSCLVPLLSRALSPFASWSQGLLARWGEGDGEKCS